jgi:hypothetical protein
MACPSEETATRASATDRDRGKTKEVTEGGREDDSGRSEGAADGAKTERQKPNKVSREKKETPHPSQHHYINLPHLPITSEAYPPKVKRSRGPSSTNSPPPPNPTDLRNPIPCHHRRYLADHPSSSTIDPRGRPHQLLPSANNTLGTRPPSVQVRKRAEGPHQAPPTPPKPLLDPHTPTLTSSRPSPTFNNLPRPPSRS